MRERLLVLGLSVAICAFGQGTYVWDFNSSMFWGTWTNNTATNAFSHVLTNTVPGASPSDYEVNTGLELNAPGGTYIHFLRAATTTVLPGSGSYISVEVTVPSTWSSGGSASLVINQCINNAVTQLGGTSIALHNGDTLRSVIFGANLWVFVNNIQAGTYTVPQTTGQPGYGGESVPSSNYFGFIRVGHHDSVAPQAVAPSSVASSLLPGSVSLKWPGVPDDPAGIGVFQYQVSRNGTVMATMSSPEFGDSTVQPSNTYTYSVQATDFHGNVGGATTITVTTPPAGAIDPRRVGLFSTGSYWGGGGEQIDTLSGNLHFTIPLATAQGRTGWTVPVNLVYDSQNWRNDNGVNWKLGADVGYGFGWKALIGSVTPYYFGNYGGVDHYVYTDSTGAEYRLDHNSGGVWSSTTQGVYVWLDTTVSPNKLHFGDGRYWVLGSVSGGTEADAGTMYPTIIEDTFGNQVVVTYDAGLGLPYSTTSTAPYFVFAANTSSRIIAIEDPRSTACYLFGSLEGCASPTMSTHPVGIVGPAVFTSFAFNYDRTNYAIPHLVSYINMMGNGGSGSGFTYATGSQEPPFGADPEFSGLNASFLSQASIGAGGPWQFGYDSSGSGELTSVIFPFGGEIAWNYSSFAYTGNRSLREVSARYLAPDSAHATNPMWAYGISRPDAQNSVIMHSAMTLTDASGVGSKTWKFNTSGNPWQLGLASEFVQSTSAGGTVLQDDVYTWSQDTIGHPYISAKSSTTGQGTGNQQTTYSAQVLDLYGNVTQASIYPFNNTTTPLRTYNNTYVSGAGYLSNYVVNLLSTSSLTTASSTITLVSNGYDYCYSGACYDTMPPTQNSPAPGEYDANSPVPSQYQGMMYYSSNPLKYTWILHYPWGTTGSTTGSDGATTSASTNSGTNYTAPQTVTAQGYSETIGYTSWLGVSQTTGANGEQLTMAYDGYGRPTTGTSAYGGVTNFTYATSAPYWQKETGPNGVTTTTLDGFGRAARVARGDTSGDKSDTDSVYAPCACSPLGKLQKVSQPYQAGGSASAWATYTYDGLGRTLSVVQPDGMSTTAYSYAGNQSKVTDPAGKWKQFTTDALGNLVTVVEPDPANQPNGTLTTSYTYDWMNHVTQVSMPRGASPNTTTQTRTFVYDNAGRLTSATNPENGTVTYTYNYDNTLQKKHDAKGQDHIYTYDSLKRLTTVQDGTDPCQAVTYTYDTNPVNSSFSQYSYGRLTTKQYGCQVVPITNGTSNGGPGQPMYTEMYSYHQAGGVTAKQMIYDANYYDTNSIEQTGTGKVEADYTFDTFGRVATVNNPANPDQYPTGTDVYGNPIYGPCPITFGYDSMGRPSTVGDGLLNWQGYCSFSWVSGVGYDYASRLTGTWIQGPNGYTSVSETRTYNVNGQLSSMNGIQYVYPIGQNNGQVSQVVDGVSGETIAYQYDALKRLVSASSTPTTGSSPTPWTQTFQYDGFGNMTAKVSNGVASQMPVNAATNQLTYAYYDANGNMTSGAGTNMAYDAANRIATAGGETFQYDPNNKMILRSPYNALPEFTFYGGQGEKLGVFRLYPPDGNHQNFQFYPLGVTISFGGRIVVDRSVVLLQDRLGTNRVSGARFYPYGDEIASTGNDREKFATYTRDSYTGLDYADQRFYASTYGRFNTPDPYAGSGGPNNPGSWNRYAYTLGDPVNRRDRKGLDSEDCGAAWVSDASLSGPCLVDGYASIDLSAVMQSACNQMIMAYGPVPVTDPACNNNAAIIPVAAPARPVAPTCSVSLYERPVDVPGVSLAADHTYLYIQDPSGAETVEAGPSYTGTGLGFGSLVGTVSSPPGNGLGSGANATNPSLASNSQVGFAYTGSFACIDAQEIDAIVDGYNNGAIYNPVPALGPGYNSNSFTYTLLLDVGLSNYFGAPGFTPGWGYVVPGLHQ